MKDIFNEDIFQEINTNENSVILEEKEAKCAFKLYNIPQNAFLIKLDINKQPFKQHSIYLKKGKEIIHKGCDYCLICIEQKKIYFFELKSNKPKVTDFTNQLIVSKIFIEYCIDLYNHISPIEINFDYEFILWSSKYNYQNTKNKYIEIDPDKYKSKIKIKAIGSPERISLNKLI